MWACDAGLTSTIVESYAGAGPLFVNTLQTFLAAHCALVGDDRWGADAVDSVLGNPNYDFIVVGAGSAGAVVANRLSENPEWRVLLIEAGGNPTLATEMWACDAGLTSTIVESYAGAGPLFVNTLQTFLAAHCALVGDDRWGADAVDSVLGNPNYDFIVVGAGSAGAVVANRLSENPEWRVLLVEAGGNPTLATEAPQVFYANLKTKENWGYRTAPQSGSCLAYDDGCSWPRGKVLGGSSSINAMFYVRGNKEDYNEWAAAGNTGWSYDDVLPLFKKSEKFYKPTPESDVYHGTDGYLYVEHTDNVLETEQIVLNATAELGIKVLNDICGETQMGITRSLTTTQDGERLSTARAFLNPIKDRSNLDVVKNAYVTKLVFKDGTNEVTGVIISKDGKEIQANARKEVVLSAGSINTPQLLMLSGIGPKKHLEELNIKVRADLPVGQNLQDHLFVTMFFKAKSELNVGNIETVLQGVGDFVLQRTGILADLSPQRVITFINTTDPNASTPDIQFHHVMFEPNNTEIVDFFDLHGNTEEVQRKFKEINKDHRVIMPYIVLLRPKSKGQLLLKSTDPNVFPDLYSNYFQEQEDVDTILRGMRYMTKLADTETFKKHGLSLTWLDLDDCKAYRDKLSDQFLECIARHLTFSLYHPVGTAKMGPDGDATSVVDPELRVRGVKNLRVVDSSIMPIIPRGNTNAPSIMIGEKGAELVTKTWTDKAAFEANRVRFNILKQRRSG
ncbi:glucose dehydrogenase [FAD, quinone] isoform X3 [Plutella xylostella]|nr:glucose dehydrogenase [FAD, quinone] isoform X3 [Plutella xylostella]